MDCDRGRTNHMGLLGFVEWIGSRIVGRTCAGAGGAWPGGSGCEKWEVWGRWSEEKGLERILRARGGRRGRMRVRGGGARDGSASSVVVYIINLIDSTYYIESSYLLSTYLCDYVFQTKKLDITI